YTQLIARRVREHRVYSEIYPHNCTASDLKLKNIKALILSGGPSSVYQENAPQLDSAIFDLEVPILGICYGLQLLIQSTGGNVKSTGRGEYGFAQLCKSAESPLLDSLPDKTQVWMSHGDEIRHYSQDWNVIGRSSNGVVAAVSHKTRPFYGVQFHPEVSHTVEGKAMLMNFLFNISHCIPNWTPADFIQEAIEDIRGTVGDKQVICGLSGGVDSSVLGTLMHRAVRERSTCIFIDNGLLRKNESRQVMTTLREGLGLQIELHDHSEKFLSGLQGVTDPEQKRKLIGKQFIRSFEEITSSRDKVEFLAQGTLYPDVIESGGIGNGPAAVIKSHHNVGGLPEDMNLKLIEPLRDLFKDEVRNVGRELGLSEFILDRHPFPGPGLAVRVMGEITEERLSVLREADHIYLEVLKETGEYKNIWQAFAVYVPVKTVGVMGDERTYESIIALRAVTSLDGMTADWYNMPHEVLNLCSSRIINEVKGVNRVVYDITSKPPGTIEWE
ncbi:MAG: glutamine-hydrolyzing GMP synthase, partial [FCB group bacterium]|nr:glutamine-hydrolyzing GMP synthase [FCB group bacterium]